MAEDTTYTNSVEEAALVIFKKGNILLNEGDTPTNRAPLLLFAQASISSVDKGTDNNSAAPCSAISSDDLATVVARIKALKSLLLACLTMHERPLGNHATPTNLATLDAWISELKSILLAHATFSSHVRAVEQRVSLHDSPIALIPSTINPTQRHLPPVAPMAPLGAPNGPPSGLGVDATSPCGPPSTTPSEASNNDNPTPTWPEIHTARAKLGACPAGAP
jgi:hypothetical protein